MLATLISFSAPSAPIIASEPEPPSPSGIEILLQLKEETPEEIIRRYSAVHGEDVEAIALAIAKVESNFDPLAKNKNSTAKGIFQFIDGTWKENCKDGNPLNTEDNIKCGVELIGKKELWHWASSQEQWLPLLSPTLQSQIREECSCVVYVRSRGLNIVGNASDQIPNSIPTIGAGIIFDYSNTGHIAIIENINEKGFIVSESNFKRCKKGTRLIPFNDPAIKGFVS